MPKRRLIFKCLVMALCACFLAALFGVTVLAALHEGHACGLNTRCAVCLRIRDAQSTLKRLLLLWTCCGLLFVASLGQAGEFVEAAAAARGDTPVACKVRMNN